MSIQYLESALFSVCTALRALPTVGQVLIDGSLRRQIVLILETLGVHNLPADATLHQGAMALLLPLLFNGLIRATNHTHRCVG